MVSWRGGVLVSITALLQSRRRRGVRASWWFMALLLAGIIAATESRRAQYRTRKLIRQGNLKCFGEDASEQVRALVINGTRTPVSVAYANWASAMITAEIAYILLSEVMGYEAHLFDTGSIVSEHPVSYAAGDSFRAM